MKKSEAEGEQRQGVVLCAASQVIGGRRPQLPMSKCGTCPCLLTKTDVANGCRRCVTCRTVTPGKPVVPRKAKPFQIIVTGRLRASATPLKANGDSWWEHLSPAELNTEAARRFVKPPHLVLQHRGQFGDGA